MSNSQKNGIEMTSSEDEYEGKPINQKQNRYTDEEKAGIIWERDNGFTTSERSAGSAKHFPGFFQTVFVTALVVAFLFVAGHHFHDQAMANKHMEKVSGTILVTGATGRLGALLYHQLQDKGETVRAFVRDPAKARTVLGCDKCDESEGIYVGDITDPKALIPAMADGSVTTLAVAVGAGIHNTPEEQKSIEFDSVVNSVRALGDSSKIVDGSSKPNHLQVVFCSSMGTENPKPSFGGDILHWKLNAEAFLSSSGISTTIVKPCGLPPDMTGKNSTLVVGHLADLNKKYPENYVISREDVASVMVEAISYSRHCPQNLRFDLCSIPGPATTDYKALLDDTKWEWQK